LSAGSDDGLRSMGYAGSVLFLHYGLKSFIARLRANLVTILAVALFVGGGMLGVTFYVDLKKQVVDTAPGDHVLVLAEGAASESNSRLDLEDVRKVEVIEGIKKEGTSALAVREFVTQIQVNATNTYGGAVIRGYDERSMQVHGVRLVEGTQPKPGTFEIMVGRRLQLRYPHLRTGYELPLIGGKAVISGVFSAGGSPYDDELWAPRSALSLLVKRDIISSMTLVAKDGASVQAVLDAINKQPNTKVHAEQLSVLRAKGAGVASILKVVLFLLVLLSVVATSAIATTIGAAVATRMPEFATMIALGLDRRMLSRVVVFESIALSLLGAILGMGVCEIVRRALGTIPLGTTPVEMTMALVVIPVGVVLATVVGLVGGIVPATSVARLDIVAMMR